MKLWKIDIHEDDWDYDRFEAGVVWANSAEEAEQIMRKAIQYSSNGKDYLWIENRAWHLVVTPAPTTGVVLAYFHAG